METFRESDHRARARAELRLGLPIVLDDLKGAPVLAMAAAVAEDRWLSAMRDAGSGGLDLVISRHRADTLRVRAYDGDLARIALSPTASASDVADIADPSRDLVLPMKGPFESRRGGDPEPARAALSFMRDAGLLPAAVISEVAPKPPAWTSACARFPTNLARKPPAPHLLEPATVASLPIEGAENSRVTIFRDPGTGDEHFALEIGPPRRDVAPLVRVHSSCYTGDLLGSLRCDCGAQLTHAIRAMNVEGGGILIVLQQEGRGIGFSNKMRAYALQDQGFDTYEANRRLGFEEDDRDFEVASQILRHLGYPEIRLLSENPAKRISLENAGITVRECASLDVESNPHNVEYLKAKARRYRKSR